MADTKTTGLTEATTLAMTDLVYAVVDPGGSPLSRKATLDTLRDAVGGYATCDGRLTLTSATPVTMADVSAAATLYFTPYKGDQVALYDGSAWRYYTFTERSLALGALSANTNYDIFLYDNSGTLTLEATAWTNDSTRATALTTQNGVYVKTGATTRRYLGTIRIATAGQCNDSVIKRGVWNYYNRCFRRLYLADATSHTYNSATFRQWNNAAAHQVDFVLGVAEDLIDVDIRAEVLPSSTGNAASALVAPDTTTTPDATMPSATNKIASTNQAADRKLLAVAAGYHYLAVLESSSSGTATFANYRFSAGVWG